MTQETGGSGINHYTKPAPICVEQLALPPAMPKMGNRFSRWLGRRLLALSGWRVAGEIPNQRHLVIAAAPHTSNWDFVHAMCLVMALGVKFSYLMKKEAFFWPFKGLFMALGGIPVDRSRGDEIMAQMQDWFDRNPTCWVALTPEGTRSQVSRFKTGFLRIAQAVEAPIMLVAFNYPDRTFYFCQPPPLSGDTDADAEAIKDFFDTHFEGRDCV